MNCKMYNKSAVVNVGMSIFGWLLRGTQIDLNMGFILFVHKYTATILPLRKV